MHGELELFFMIRSQWLIDGRLSALARMHTIPTAFYAKDEVELASSKEELEKIFRDCQDDLLRDGIVRIRPRILEISETQKSTFPVLVEYRAMDRYGQIIFLVKIRYYLHIAKAGGFIIEMQEELEWRKVAQTPFSPSANTVVH